MRVTNPYQTDTRGALNPDVTDAMQPVGSSYAVPSPLNTDAPYNDEQGWAAHPRTSPTGTPDAERLGTIPVYQRQVFPDRAPDVWYDAYTDFDRARRQAVESQSTTGQREGRDHEFKRAPDVRWTPPMPSRLTAFLNPHTYLFTRPFNRPPARNNGMHFSMADHRRKYDVLGMNAPPSKRNTYRVDPAPWDANLYDAPPQVMPVQAEYVGPQIPPRTGGAYRTGG
jgi:hypothetical protein